MIPHFPHTKPLSLADKENIESLTRDFPPFSDFNFVSLFSYDTENKVEVSKLFGNLVLKFQDYLDLDMFYTFIGNNDVSETIHTLLSQASKEGLRPYLKLVPHSVVEHISHPEAFLIQEDRNNFDYIIDAQAFGNLEGRTYHSKRKELRKFAASYEGKYTFVQLDLTDSSVVQDILSLFSFWIAHYDKNPTESQHEYHATEKLLHHASTLGVIGYGLYIDQNLAAYMIAETTFHQYAVLQFGKWNMSYRGLGEFFEKECVYRLWEKGCVSINLEQDLGIEGLRHAKELWKPSFFLKKYQISESALQAQ